tara:strand:+ start:257 stop:616 length:360 start_codon:yes stop_codon:yes gene_type:complete
MKLDFLPKNVVKVSTDSPYSVPNFKNLDVGFAQSNDNDLSKPDLFISLSGVALKKSASTFSKRRISYKMDNESNYVVANIVDSESGEVIRQIPDEKGQRLAKGIAEYQKAILTNRRLYK